MNRHRAEQTLQGEFFMGSGGWGVGGRGGGGRLPVHMHNSSSGNLRAVQSVGSSRQVS